MSAGLGKVLSEARMAGEESVLTVPLKVKRYFPNLLQKRRVGTAAIAP
jgi:hypothetical protein